MANLWRVRCKPQNSSIFPAFQAGYEGSIPFTRSIFYFNRLESFIFQNLGEIEILATNHHSAVTRRNPRFSGALFENLWRVCGEGVEMALPIRIASVSGLQWGIWQSWTVTPV